MVNGSSGAVVVAADDRRDAQRAGDRRLDVPGRAGSSPTTSLGYAQVTGTKATAAKHLGS